MRPKPKEKAMTVRMPVDQAESLELIATVDSRSVTWIIRQAVSQYQLERLKDPAFQTRLRAYIKRQQLLLEPQKVAKP